MDKNLFNKIGNNFIRNEHNYVYSVGFHQTIDTYSQMIVSKKPK